MIPLGYSDTGSKTRTKEGGLGHPQVVLEHPPTHYSIVSKRVYACSSMKYAIGIERLRVAFDNDDGVRGRIHPVPILLLLHASNFVIVNANYVVTVTI